MKELKLALNKLHHWNALLEDMEKSDYSDFGDEIFQTRSRHALAFSLPFLASIRPNIENLTCLEVGCGFGAKSLPLSLLVKNYIGVDIDKQQIDRAVQLKNAISSSAKFLQLSADSITELLKDVQPDVVILYAVLEHLTLDERMILLRSVYKCLKKGAIMYVGETPNRLNHIDFHSSQLPYFNMVPPELAAKIYTTSRRKEWVNRVEKEDTVNLGLHRRGQAVSFHDFWAAFGESPDHINNLIIADGFSSHKLNWKSWKLCQTHFLAQFNYLRNTKNEIYRFNLHPTFAKSMLDFIIEKPKVNLSHSEIFDVTLELPDPFIERQDWLGNPVANLKNTLEVKLDYLPKSVKIGILKHTFKGDIELFDEEKNLWLKIDVSDYIDSDYISLCGDHLFFDLPLRKRYKIRSLEKMLTIGLLVRKLA